MDGWMTRKVSIQCGNSHHSCLPSIDWSRCSQWLNQGPIVVQNLKRASAGIDDNRKCPAKSHFTYQLPAEPQRSKLVTAFTTKNIKKRPPKRPAQATAPKVLPLISVSLGYIFFSNGSFFPEVSSLNTKASRDEVTNTLITPQLQQILPPP